MSVFLMFYLVVTEQSKCTHTYIYIYIYIHTCFS